MQISDAILKAEAKMTSVGDPEQETADGTEMKYVTVGTDIDAEEFLHFCNQGREAFYRNLDETGGDMNSVLNALLIQTALAFREIGLAEAITR